MNALTSLHPSRLSGPIIVKLARVRVQMSCLRISIIKARMKLSSEQG